MVVAAAQRENALTPVARGHGSTLRGREPIEPLFLFVIE